MIDVLVEAAVLVANPEYFQYLIIGVLMGMTIGFFPGLGGTTGLAVLLPFVYGMDPISGLALLVGCSAVTATADTFPSVLLGVPGTAASQATIMDGYPMAREGRAGEALGAGFLCSMVGGVIGAVILIAALGVAKPILLLIGSPELFMLTLLALSFVGVLSDKSALMGLASAALGGLLGLIGIAMSDGVPRFTFDTLYLYDGFSVVILAIGLFGIPEIVHLLAKGSAITEGGVLKGGMREGFKASIKEWRLVLRSASIGVGLGVVPGLGGAVTDWIAYGSAKQSLKNTEGFGKGDVRGVIAPESANNANRGGALLPTMVFGIPGSASMAVMLAGFTLLGMPLGPSMAGEDLPISLSIAWSLALANVLAAGLCLLFIKPMSRLTLLKPTRLMPFILVILSMAAYQASYHFADLFGLLIIGLLGWTMMSVGLPRAPLLVGFVIIASSERYLHLTRTLYDWDWVLNPPVVVIGLITVFLTVVVPIRRSLAARKGRSTVADPADQAEVAAVPGGTGRSELSASSGADGSRDAPGDHGPPPRQALDVADGRPEWVDDDLGTTKLRLALFVVMLGAFVYSIVESFGFREASMPMPLLLGSLGAAFSAALLIREIHRYRVAGRWHELSRDTHGEASESGTRLNRRSLYYGAYLVGLMLLVVLIGFLPAAFAFIVVFLLREGKLQAWKAVLLAAALIGVFVLLKESYGIRFPKSIFL